MASTNSENGAALTVLVEVVHPAHVLFFANPIRILKERGHRVLVASRDKDVTLALLHEMGIEHRCLSRAGKVVSKTEYMLSSKG